MNEAQQALSDERAAFGQVFGESSETAQPTSTAAPEAAAEDPGQAGPQAAAEPAKAEDGTEAQPETAPAAQAAEVDEDPVLLDGLKRSELRRLLGNAADVESLKRQLDKAHGNIGELNRKFQQSQAAPAAAPAAPAAPELSPELKQFEQDFPEVAQYVRALGGGQQAQAVPAQPAQTAQEALQPEAGQAPGQEQPQAGESIDFELVLLDRMHKGWREKVQSPDFALFLAADGGQARTAFDAAQSADEMLAVVQNFDQWGTARVAATDKHAKGQQRLLRATTPTGNAPKPQAAMTEQEAFLAALNS
jgi:hypothetical protein